MATQLKNIVRFINVAVGVPTALAHGLNIDGRAVVPDLVQGVGDFTVTADATNVTVTNNGAAPASIDVFVAHWHTFERTFGPVSTLALAPQPLVLVGGSAASAGFNYFGDGSDGDVVLGAPLTLTRDMYYNTLDTATFAVDTAGFRIFVRGQLTMGAGSIIRNNGANAVAGAAGAGGSAGTLQGGGAGGAGGVTAGGSAGTGVVTAAHTANRTAGAGGSAEAALGGAAGVATALTATQTKPRSLPEIITMTTYSAGANPRSMTPGAGGGGGGGSGGAGAGGGGGGGGGMVLIAARAFSLNATAQIHADGGNGANGVVANGGGGGGGTGGVIALVFEDFTEVGTQLFVDGGSGSLGAGVGGSGGAGQDGTIWLYDVTV